MENPFKNFSKKDWLYVGGAVASLVAVAYLIARNNGGMVAVPPGTHTDVLNDASTSPGGFSSPGYTNYNTGSYGAPPVEAGGDVSASPSQLAGSPCCNECAGGNALGTGDTYSGLDSLLNYYTQTNPNYVALQEAQLQQYAAYFATGESYAKGVFTTSPSGISPVSA